MVTLCNCCTAIATAHATDCCGYDHHACTEHAKYLDGWLRDAEFEVNAESNAARREEYAAHGDDSEEW